MKISEMNHCVWRSWTMSGWAGLLPGWMICYEIDRKVYNLLRRMTGTANMPLWSTILFMHLMSKFGHARLFIICDKAYRLDEMLSDGKWIERTVLFIIRKAWIFFPLKSEPHECANQAIALDISASHAEFQCPPKPGWDIYINQL